MGVREPGGAPKGEAATLGQGLDQTVDFGWWAFICKGLVFFLRFFHHLGNNWGVAIILLIRSSRCSPLSAARSRR